MREEAREATSPGQMLGAMCDRAREVFSGIVEEAEIPLGSVITKNWGRDNWPRVQNSGTK